MRQRMHNTVGIIWILLLGLVPALPGGGLSTVAQTSQNGPVTPVASQAIVDQPAASQETTDAARNVKVVGHIGGASYAVAVQGDYAYVGEGASLTILDISNPAAPAIVDKTDLFPNIVQDVHVSGRYAYIADYAAGLRVVDVSDPNRPTEVGFYDTPERAHGVAVAGGYAYVADWDGGLRVVDVSDPTQPTEVGFYDTPGWAYGVAVAGGYAYIADWDGGLRVVDVSDPTQPTEVGSYAPGIACDVAVAGGYVYIAAEESGLRVIDVSDPTRPTEAGFYDIPGTAWDVAVAEGYAYVAADRAGLRVVDVSDPTQPVEVGFYDTPGVASGVAVAGEYAYVADGEIGLGVVDISDPAHPAKAGFYNTPGEARDVAVAGGYAYVAADRAGLRIVDVSDPTQPVEVGFYDTPGRASGVAVAGGYAYIADGNGLRVIDVSNPTRPVEVGFLNAWGWENVVVTGGYAYLANGDLRIVDVSDPARPTEVGSYGMPGTIWNVAVAEGYAYVTDSDWGLQVVDVSDPTQPSEVGTCPMSSACSVAVAEGYAYVIDSWTGLRVVDVSDPTQPTEVGSFNWQILQDVAVAGGYAYISYGGITSYGRGILWVVDVSEPTHPTEVGKRSTPRPAQGVAAAGEHAYIADGEGGLLILRYVPGDDYEPDYTCDLAPSIPTDGTVQHRTFHLPGDRDGVIFHAITGTTYILQGSDVGPQVDIVPALHNACDWWVTLTDDDLDLGGGFRLVWTCPAAGDYYLEITNRDPNVYGDDAIYDLSIRQQTNDGAAIIVAGHYSEPESVMANFTYVANMAYRTFRAAGYPSDRIYYLHPDLSTDADNDGLPDVDALSNSANLQQAITSWAASHVGPDAPLYLYLVVHGGDDLFYMDTQDDMVTAADLDSWLTQLESATDCDSVNVILEACESGSFIIPPDPLSRPGRVIITSARDHQCAYGPTGGEGAYFSNFFLAQLGSGADLWTSYDLTRDYLWELRDLLNDQTPWLDDNGDGVADAQDGTVARRRGSLASYDNAVPWIAAVSPAQQSDGATAVLTATVYDDGSLTEVWAEIYPPSYQPPDAPDSMQVVNVPQARLAQSGEHQYQAVYGGFTEIGEYRVVIHARDEEGNHALPRPTTVHAGWKVYLPLVVRGQ